MQYTIVDMIIAKFIDKKDNVVQKKLSFCRCMNFLW